MHKPIVMIDGKPKQLPDGATVAGMPMVLPVGLAVGGVVRVALDLQARLAVGLAGGGSVSVLVEV